MASSGEVALCKACGVVLPAELPEGWPDYCPPCIAAAQEADEPVARDHLGEPVQTEAAVAEEPIEAVYADPEPVPVLERGPRLLRPDQTPYDQHMERAVALHAALNGALLAHVQGDPDALRVAADAASDLGTALRAATVCRVRPPMTDAQRRAPR